ncbi:hypothetical protein ABH920_007880 [Catenulispora sp. EB89]|uniref:hypothetical protein n=1 Tax=Catenulispora sp. EB89 TaxID=3156257 RepID=UPI0035110AB7
MDSDGDAEPDRWSRLRQATADAVIKMLDGPSLDVLARCAIAGTFDEDVFSSLLQTNDLTLESLATRFLVAPAAPSAGADGTPTRYRLTGTLADAFWEHWQETVEPDYVRELSLALSTYYAGLDGPGQAGHEQLRHLLLADGERAHSVFVGLFRAADQRFDLSECWNLLDILDDPPRSRRLPDVLVAERERCRSRARIRAAWADDFRVTRPSVYLERASLQQALGDVLGDVPDAPWLVRLKGVGGTGKTTLVRWFTSRRCVAADLDGPLPIPCAWIDGATTSTVELLERPWLLLVAAAARLGRLLDDRRFEGFLDEYDRYRDLLIPAGDGGASIVTGTGVDAAEVEHRFADETESLGPFVLILDNLDDLYQLGSLDRQRLEALFAMLERVHRATHGRLRVVIACRYDFRDLLPDAEILRRGAIEAVRFEEQEVRELLHRHGIDDPAVVQAVTERSDRLPVLVTGYAAILPRGVTAAAAKEIVEAPGPVIAYIAERIIGQTPDLVVRWALQYSSVAVIFDREFFSQVMLPVLRASEPDGEVRCQMNRASKAKLPRNPEWEVPDPSDHERIVALWEQINVVSRGLPWFKVVDGGSHAIVEADRRAELSADVALHDATRRIHERAVAYYGELGEFDASPGDTWPQWQRRRVYHAVHLDPDRGLDDWRQATGTARAQGRLDWARALTANVLADFGFRVLPAGDGDAAAASERGLLGPAAAYEMYVDLARTDVQTVGLLPGSSRPTPAAAWPARASYAVRAAEEARAECVADGHQVPSNPYWEILTFLECVLQDSESAAGRDRDWVERVAITDSQTRDAFLVLARHLRRAGWDDEAPGEDAYADAFARARAAGEGEPWVAAEAASWHLDAERAEAALRWCERGVAVPERPYGPDAAATALLRVLHASALLQLGRPADVLDVLAEHAGYQPLGLELGTVAARAFMALRRPLQAVSQLREPDRNAESLPAAVRLDAALLEADVNGQLLDRDAVDVCLDRAESLAGLTMSPTHRALIVTARARAALDAFGDLTQAGEVLDRPLPGTLLDAAARVDVELVRAAVIHRSQALDPELGLARLSMCLDTVWEAADGAHGSRGMRVKALAAELDYGSLLAAGRAERALDRLLDELGEEPAASRFRLLEPLARCRALELGEAALASARHTVSTLFPVAERPEPAEAGERAAAENDAWRRLTLAELYRVIGAKDPMVKMRDQAVSVLGERHYFVRWQGLDAVRRVGAPRAIRPLELEDFALQFRAYPALVSAAFTVWVEAYDADLTSPESEDLLRRARELSDSTPNVSQYSVGLVALLEKQARADGREVDADQLGDEVARLRDRLGVQRRAPWRPRTADAGQIVVRDTGGGIRISTAGYAAEEVDIPAEALVWDDEGALVARSRLSRSLEEQLAARGDVPTAVGFSWSAAALAAQPWEVLQLRGGPLFRAPGVSDVVRHEAKRGPDRYRIRLLRRVMAAYWSVREGNEAGAATGTGTGAGNGDAGEPTRHDPSAFDARSSKRFERALRDFAGELGLSWASAGPDRERIESAAFAEAVEFFRQRRATAPGPLRVRVVVPAVGGSMSALSVIEQRVRQVDSAYRGAPAAGGEPGARRARVKVDFGAEAFAAGPGDKRPCDILHLCGPLRAAEGLPLIGVPRDGSTMSERELDSLVEACTDIVPPLVVLDLLAPKSSSPDEVRRQLEQRNMFAHRLLALGGVDTVIATGFERPGAGRQPKALAAAFTRHATPSAACRTIRATTSSASGSLAYETTALFSGLRPQLIFEPGLFVGG